MAEFPALPLFTDAYIADTAHLTNEEHGVYLRLLMFAWRTSSCALPNDDARLALMVGVTKGKWAKLKPTIMAFWKLSDDEWTQKKLSSQRDFVSKQREQKRLAGEASAKARALKSLDTSSTAVGQPLPTAPQQPIPITKPITTSSKNDAKASTKKRATRLPDDWHLPMEYGEWALSQGFTRDQIKFEADKFKDYWISQGGQKAAKTNWLATWRNWIRNNQPLGGKNGSGINNNQNGSGMVGAAMRSRASREERPDVPEGRPEEGDGWLLSFDE